MSRKRPRPSAATSEFLLPQPSAEGVAKLRVLYAGRAGLEMPEPDARRVLPADGKRSAVARDPERFAPMRKAWELMLQGGRTVEAVTDTLNDSWGYRTRPTPRGGNVPLSPNGLYQAFRSPFYAGFVRSKGELVRGRHEATVTPDEFERVQALLSRRSFPARRAVSHPFTGVMACAYCGQRVTAERKRLRNGTLWDTYHCSDSYGRCTRRGMSLAQVEAAVAETLVRVSVDTGVADVALAEIARSLSGGEGDVAALLGRQEAARLECRARLEKLDDMWLSGMMADRKRYAELQERELKSLNDLILDVERTRGELDRMRENARRARDFAAFSKERFLAATADERRALARALADRYAFHGREKRILIEVEPLLLEFADFGRGNTGPLEPRETRSGKKRQAPFEKALVSGGRASGGNEPLPQEEPCANTPEPPLSLLEALRGPLFPDLGLGLEGAA